VSGGKASRQKGDRAERVIVRYLQERGHDTERIPLSGSAGGSFRGDVRVRVVGRELIAEVKCRANGFRELYSWLLDRDCLVVRADRSAPLLVLPLALAADLIEAAEKILLAGGHRDGN
jgi:hypothetical protein